jgi:putative FmdB family regulatory protein
MQDSREALTVGEWALTFAGMPIYEFQCRDCQFTEELLQKLSDPAPAVCPSCGKKGTLDKLVSHTSFQLKGGGWYSDLYASTKPESSSSTTTSSKGESTPAPAPVATPAPAPAATKSDT